MYSIRAPTLRRQPVSVCLSVQHKQKTGMAMNAAAVLPGGLNAQRRILGPRCPLQSKRKVRRQPPTSVPASDTAHIVQVVHGAREKLEMLHSAVSNVKRKECLEPTLIRRIGGDKVSKLGDIEGMGLWLRAASIRIEADGTISPEELQRFCFEGEAAFADCQGSAINFTVIYALFLTICISLMVLHTGGNAYNHSFENDFFREALENGDAGWGDYLAWCDLATFFDPEDEDKQRKTRRDCYLAECISLSLAALIHTLGLIDALFLAVTFSCAFPTVADKYAFVLEQGARITSM